MIGTIAKWLGYTKAPKATYVMRHPVKGAKMMAAARGGKWALKGRTGIALGALLAIPLGIWAAARR